MKPHLLIRNSGIAPLESFTILGLSTSRGNDDKIGQFGSGSKHGVLTLLRAGIIPRIFIGEDELSFFTVPAKMQNFDYHEVRYTFRGETHKTGMCLEFGALDWTDLRMAIREFICNALDQQEVIQNCLSLQDEIEPKANETRVYVPAESAEIQEYWLCIRDYFLHFDKLEHTTVFPARTKTTKLYRRGVFVREVGTDEEPAIFHYNFQDGRIDESRNLQDSNIGGIIARLLLKSPAELQTVFASFAGGARYEHGLGYSVPWGDDDSNRAILDAWRKTHAQRCFTTELDIMLKLQRKNIEHVVVPNSWGGPLERAKVTNGATLLSKLDNAGGEECEPTAAAMAAFRRAWAWIERAKLTNGLPFPTIKCFSVPMHCKNELIGYCRGGTVYLNLDYDSNELAALEELAHYVTGSKDETRDFQDFAFKLAFRMAKFADPN